jgi:hypothetical protein
MGLLKYALVFHTNTGQIIGIKEAPVVDVIGRYPPVGEPKGLRLDQFVKFFETFWIGGVSVNGIDRLLDTRGNLGRPGAEFSETALVNLLVAIALGDALNANFTSLGKVAESRNQALKFQEIGILFTQHFSRFRRAILENARIFSRVDREPMFKVRNIEFAAIDMKNQLYIATLKHRAVVIAEDRKKNFALEFFF